MDRREWLGFLGAGGIGTALTGSTCEADDHGAKTNDKFLAAASGFHAHFCGIHVAKMNPKFQLVAHHYCSLGKSVHQCLLFDSHEVGAKLLGLEYIISDEAYRALDDKEKRYWHPHTYEVLAGGLTAPGMAPEEESKFMKAILTTWGKTWHTWPDPKTDVPIGEPLLMWSLGSDDQVDQQVLATRDKLLNVNGAKIREARMKEFGLEVPQVPFPKSLEEVGRQWTGNGEDKPTKRQ